ncbi:hypothetical protein [Pleomorphovibrio marinus]|uniref:hypothetical protein n=1 Tax=Pleomorphovibrio marinus TaxID=2164132 RepID=UPI000E0CB792|nr:hypothetical protein [Pleomorphovibrio marinus]
MKKKWNSGRKRRTKGRFILGGLCFAVLLMTFGSYGSFNPLEVGFYTSLGAGALWFFLSYHGFKWLRRKSEV